MHGRSRISGHSSQHKDCPPTQGHLGPRYIQSTTSTMLTSVHYKHNAHQCPLQAQCSPVSTTSTVLTSVHYKHNAHQCPLQAQCPPVSTISTMLTCVHYKHNAHQCPLQAQCSPVSMSSQRALWPLTLL